MDRRHSEKRPVGSAGPAIHGDRLAEEIGLRTRQPARFEGAPVRIEWARDLHAWRGRLRFGPGPGQEIHAASFLRDRRIVLDQALRSDPDELSRIALHELFHFVWVRLGNPIRRQWEELLRNQVLRGAKRELGWSAEQRLRALRPSDVAGRTRRWREYICESFCDTAAWAFGMHQSHDEFSLERRFRPSRLRWFAEFRRHRNGVFPI